MESQPVPSRKDPTYGVDLYSRSRANEISGRDPGFVYEYFEARNQEHPSYVGDRLVRHEVGDPSTGYATVEPWEVVHVGEVKQGGKRADDSKGVDTAVRHGSMVLCRTPKDNHKKYLAVKEQAADAVSSSLTGTQRQGDRHVGSRARVGIGNTESGADLLDAKSLIGS